MVLNLLEFEQNLKNCIDLSLHGAIAVAVSGGPDSMAMGWLLSSYAQKHNKTIYAYTVDHGLRAESESEARMVSQWLSSIPHIHHKILKWEGDKPDTRILEEARNARYALIAKAAKKDGCDHIFVAHHMDDQAETFLMRLAKGSGLDGLSAMKPVQDMTLNDGSVISIVRPLLDVPKADLIELCDDHNIPYVRDPTNENKDYMRPRLRAAQSVLAEEGLTAKRLATTAQRLGRARAALEIMADELFQKSVKDIKTDEYVFDYSLLKKAPDELVIRVVLMAIEKIDPKESYGPRMERVESLVDRILREEGFKSATLAGCLFCIDKKTMTLSIKKEIGA